MAVPTPITDLQTTAFFAGVRATFNPPVSWRTQGLLSYTATLALAASPFTTLQTVTNAPLAGGVDPMAEFTFGHLDNGVGVTISIVATNASGDSTPVVSGTLTPVELPGQAPNVAGAFFGEMAWQYQTKVLAPCPRMRFGKKYLTELKDGPYVVLVPGRATILGGTHLGSGAPGSPLQIWTKQQQITAYCWGVALPSTDPTADYMAAYGVAEQLLNNSAACLHILTFGEGMSIGDEFNPDQANETRGMGQTLQFYVNLPITEIPIPPADFATVTEFDLTTDI